MRILLLGSSNDAGTWFEGGKKRHEIAGEQLEAEFGEPMEFTIRSLWPTKELPGLVAGWIERYDPDLIYIDTASHWFLYRSVPQRAKRIFGKAGPTVGDAGFRIASSKRWSHNAVFRTTRRVLTATMGGDSHFTADEVLERLSECIRIAVRREGAIVAVKGPHGKTKYARTQRGFLKDEAKRLRVHRGFEALCEQLHVPYEGKADPVYRERIYRHTSVGDGLHSDAARHPHRGRSVPDVADRDDRRRSGARVLGERVSRGLIRGSMRPVNAFGFDRGETFAQARGRFRPLAHRPTGVVHQEISYNSCKPCRFWASPFDVFVKAGNASREDR